MTAAQALQTAYLPAATMLNYHWDQQVGSIEPGKFADLIAVAGNPLADITEMQRVRLRDERRPRPSGTIDYRVELGSPSFKVPLTENSHTLSPRGEPANRLPAE